MGAIIEELKERSGNKCELCGSTDNLTSHEVQPPVNRGAYGNVLICNTCLEQVEDADKMDKNHWHCLNDSMWSEEDAVKVIAWRMLTRLGNQDLLDMMYLEDEAKTWAEATGEGKDKVVHRDSNGVILNSGDSITGLVSNTIYDFYIQNDCSDSANGVSVWVGPYTFTTQPGPHVIPLLEDFESGFTNFDNALGNDVDWAISTTYFHTGAQSIHNANSSSNENIAHEIRILS